MEPSTINVEINAKLQWRLERTPSGALLAICDAIGLTLEGENEDEVRSLIAEGLHFFFLGHLDDGTLASFLRSKGWTPSQPIPRAVLPSDVVRFDVPWELQPAHAA